jgi:hypothetical protein
VVTLTGTGEGVDGRGECAWPLEAWNNPISASELVTARSIIGAQAARLLTGAEFTDAALKQAGDLSQYRILHFATHGLVAAPKPECPAQPALLTSFARGPSGGFQSDGLLTFKEIFDLRLDADLVILSACDTAGAASAAATREAGLAGGGDFALDGLVRAFRRRGRAFGGRQPLAAAGQFRRNRAADQQHVQGARRNGHGHGVAHRSAWPDGRSGNLPPLLLVRVRRDRRWQPPGPACTLNHVDALAAGPDVRLDAACAPGPEADRTDPPCVTLLFLGLALLFARYGWMIPLNMEAERALYDVRVILTAPRVDQDKRIAMVVFNDETLRRVEKRSPLDRKTLADALRAIDGMGAKAIGIDILIDQPQAEDPELIETFRSLKTPTYLAYANNATNPEQIEVWQEEFLTRFLAQAGGGGVLKPTSIRLVNDPDNVIRRWPAHPDTLPALFATALAPIRPEFRIIAVQSPGGCRRARNIRSSPSCRSTCSRPTWRPRSARRSRAAMC